MKCPKCGKEMVRVDHPDNTAYHTEDTEWGIPPKDGDPGWLVAKIGTKPAFLCEGGKL